jgi:hypothetical protein
MAREVRFVAKFSPSDRYRQRHFTEKGRVLKFTVQYETKIGGNWLPVVRYDTAHGFFHRDQMHPNKRTEKIFIKASDYNKALTFAADDIKKNWEIYKVAFLKEVQDESKE